MANTYANGRVTRVVCLRNHNVIYVGVHVGAKDNNEYLNRLSRGGEEGEEQADDNVG